MITVLFVTAAVMLLAITFSIIAMSERRSTASTVQTEKALQLADAGSERARRVIVDVFDETFLSISNFLSQVADGGIEELAGVTTVTVDGNDVHWEVVGVSDPGAAFGWIDVASTASLGNDAVQTVIRRIGFGASSTFNLAMLSETTDCMFCHLRVNGDVGNLVEMRPGWGSESGGGGEPNSCSGGDGRGSGGNGSGLGVSRINGNVFAARSVTNDCRTNNRLNGAEVTGVIEENSRNASLPVDLDNDGIADFPPIIREIAVENALGSISAATGSCVVAFGSSFNPASCGSMSADGTIDGNLVLHGTFDDPINLDGDIWVEGDIVISGYVTGLGGLYSGRNIYIAGDLQAKNAPYRVVSGECQDENGTTIMTASELAATGFSPQDACARRSIADETDALRIAARGSVIIGDYTEYGADGELKSFAGRQSADFYRAQFGFYGNRTYDRRNGDELRCGGGSCRNAEGEVVSSANQVSVDGYDGSFRPGRVTSGGFSSWMTDGQYQEILGTEEFDHNTWRWSFSDADFTDGNRLAEVFHNMIGSGFPFEQARAILDRRMNFRSLTDWQWNNFLSRAAELGVPLPAGVSRNSLEQQSNQQGRFRYSDDAGSDAYANWSGNDLRVLHTAEREYETQVNRIDAFLYANQRIAGKTSMQAMSITGGLVARDLGILAPGRALENWSLGDAAPYINANRSTACSTPGSKYYVYGSEDCALTVNYDHRLRNGGYGYNIIEGQIGITLDWRVADTAAERVSP